MKNSTIKTEENVVYNTLKLVKKVPDDDYKFINTCNKDFKIKYLRRRSVSADYATLAGNIWSSYINVYILYKDTIICTFNIKVTDGCCGSATLFDFCMFRVHLNKDLFIKNSEVFNSIAESLTEMMLVTQICATNSNNNDDFDIALKAFGFNQIGDSFFNPNSSNYVVNWIYLSEYRNNEYNFNDDDEDEDDY